MLCLSHFAREAVASLFLTFHLFAFRGVQRGFLLVLGNLLSSFLRKRSFLTPWEEIFYVWPALPGPVRGGFSLRKRWLVARREALLLVGTFRVHPPCTPPVYPGTPRTTPLHWTPASLRRCQQSAPAKGLFSGFLDPGVHWGPQKTSDI